MINQFVLLLFFVFVFGIGMAVAGVTMMLSNRLETEDVKEGSLDKYQPYSKERRDILTLGLFITSGAVLFGIANGLVTISLDNLIWAALSFGGGFTIGIFMLVMRNRLNIKDVKPEAHVKFDNYRKFTSTLVVIGLILTAVPALVIVIKGLINFFAK